jgi:serine/threonine protein kinase
MLLTKDNQVKVADFGISGVADRFNPELNWGTLKYMPPEVLAKSKITYTFARDVWACGVILFYMLEGNLPFTGHSSR